MTDRTKQAPYNKLVPSCGNMIMTTDYSPILDPSSNRYYSKGPTVDATPGTQPVAAQVPTPFTVGGGEYKDATFWGNECNTSFYNQAGFAPGMFNYPDPQPSAEQLLPLYDDNRAAMTLLEMPGVMRTGVYSTQSARDKATAIAQEYLAAQNDDTLSRIFSPICTSEISEDALPNPMMNPQQYCTPSQQLLVGSLQGNPLHTSCMERGKAVGGPSGADYTQYTGVRRNIALDKLNEERWQIVNNGTNTLQERLI